MSATDDSSACRRGLAEERSAMPLAGRTVVVTRPRGQAGGLAAPHERAGAHVLLCPVVEIVPLEPTATLRAALTGLGAYDTVVFTSANAVAIFCECLCAAGGEPVALAACELVAIGPGTAAALEERGLVASLVPEDHVAEGLVSALAARTRPLVGRRVLLPRSRSARPVLPEELRRHGALVDVVDLYDAVPAAGLPCAATAVEAADYVTFTSSSTVRAFVALMGATRLPERLAGVRLASIGPVTSATLGECGLPVAVEAAVSTATGHAAAVARDAAAGVPTPHRGAAGG